MSQFPRRFDSKAIRPARSDQCGSRSSARDGAVRFRALPPSRSSLTKMSAFPVIRPAKKIFNRVLAKLPRDPQDARPSGRYAGGTASLPAVVSLNPRAFRTMDCLPCPSPVTATEDPSRETALPSTWLKIGSSRRILARLTSYENNAR